MKRYLPRILDNLIWILLLLVFTVFSIFANNFLSMANILNIFFHAAVLGILVIGESFTLISGNFDISIESTLGLCGLIGIWLIAPVVSPYFGSGLNVPPLLSIVTILLLGLLIGWIIGNLVTRFKMNNWIVTIAMLITLRGAMLLVTSGNTVATSDPVYVWIGLGKVAGIPVPVVVVLFLFLLAHIVTQYTPFGRELYAIGANKQAARASGINPEQRIRQVYLISGLLAAFAGLILSARLTSVNSTMGKNMVFEVLAAAVIGGISLSGGQGSMIGAFGGVLLLSTIGSGLNLMDLDPLWVDSIRGVIILFAMFIDSFKQRFVADINEQPAKPPLLNFLRRFSRESEDK
jgi:ribose/xylose/arabinose/galactoside ABC-type transport system permease subunit